MAEVSSGERNSSSVKRSRREDLPTELDPIRRILRVGMSDGFREVMVERERGDRRDQGDLWSLVEGLGLTK